MTGSYLKRPTVIPLGWQWRDPRQSHELITVVLNPIGRRVVIGGEWRGSYLILLRCLLISIARGHGESLAVRLA